MESTAYTAPVLVATTATLKAAAFKTGWEPSVVTSIDYVVDGDGPTVTTSVTPTANDAGWHNSKVTVRFLCWAPSGVAVCPAPVVVTQEGTSIVVAGTAIDTLGNETEASVTLSIDRTAPSVVLQESAAYLSTTSASHSVDAAVSDALSGVVYAACNGTEITMTSGMTTCSAALQPGRNAVTVMAVDQAGNSRSHGLLVTRTGVPTSVAISPGTSAVLVGKSRYLTLTDNFGTTVEADSWTSADPAVATVETEEEEVRVVGQNGGTTTITATFGTLTATTNVTVVSGVAIGVGTIQWSVAAPAASFDAVLKASQVDSSNYSYLATDTTAGVVVGIDTFGRETARYPIPTGLSPLMANVKGGFLLWDSELRGIPSAGGRPWTFRFSGFPMDILQSPNGSVYIVYQSSVDVLDGETGNLIAREQLPRGVRRTFNIDCILGDDDESYNVQVGQAAIDNLGRLRLPFSTSDGWFDYLPCGTGTSTFDYRVRLLTMDGETPSYFTVASDDEYPVSFPALTLADTDGGVIVTWSRTATSSYEGAYVTDTSVTNFTATPQMLYGLVDLDSETIYSSTIGGLTAVDTTNNMTRWSSAVTVDKLLAAASNGTLVAQNSATGMVYHFDSSGNATAVGTMNADAPILVGDGTYTGLQTSAVVNVEHAYSLPATSFSMMSPEWPDNGGNESKQRAPSQNGCKPSDMPPFSIQWKALSPGGSFTYGFDGDWPKFMHSVDKAFEIWTKANFDTTLNTSYERALVTTPNISLEKILSLPAPNGTIIDGRTLGTPDPTTGIITNATIQFNTHADALTRDIGYLKVALHEIGHTLGLGDANLESGKTVMNLMKVNHSLPPALGKPNDQGGNIPTVVKPCDAQRAHEAPQRSWPPVP